MSTKTHRNRRTTKTAADRVFEQRVKDAVQKRDWDEVAKLFVQYGNYLELMEGAV